MRGKRQPESGICRFQAAWLDNGTRQTVHATPLRQPENRKNLSSTLLFRLPVAGKPVFKPKKQPENQNYGFQAALPMKRHQPVSWRLISFFSGGRLLLMRSTAPRKALTGRVSVVKKFTIALVP